MSFIAVLVFAVLNEAIIEYIVGSVRVLRPYLPLLSLASAILLSFGFEVSLFAVFFGTEIKSPFWEFFLSAFIIARLSNYINDLAQKFLESK